jgi:acetyl-CoA acetyltransferase
MSVSRLSISVPPDVADAIRAAAEAAGLPVSVWLTRVAEQAAAEQAAIADGLAAVAEFEAEYGALTDAERAEARQALIDAGVIPPQRAAS